MLYRVREVKGGLIDGMLYKSRYTAEKILEDLDNSKSYEIEELSYHIKPGISIARAIRVLSERMFEFENGRILNYEIDDILEKDNF